MSLWMKIFFMTISAVANQDKVIAHPTCILFHDGVSCQSSKSIPRLVNDSSIHPYYYHGTVIPSSSLPWSASPTSTSPNDLSKELPSLNPIMHEETPTQLIGYDNEERSTQTVGSDAAVDYYIGCLNNFFTNLVTLVHLENARTCFPYMDNIYSWTSKFPNLTGRSEGPGNSFFFRSWNGKVVVVIGLFAVIVVVALLQAFRHKKNAIAAGDENQFLCQRLTELQAQVSQFTIEAKVAQEENLLLLQEQEQLQAQVVALKVEAKTVKEENNLLRQSEFHSCLLLVLGIQGLLILCWTCLCSSSGLPELNAQVVQFMTGAKVAAEENYSLRQECDELRVQVAAYKTEANAAAEANRILQKGLPELHAQVVQFKTGAKAVADENRLLRKECNQLKVQIQRITNAHAKELEIRAKQAKVENTYLLGQVAQSNARVNALEIRTEVLQDEKRVLGQELTQCMEQRDQYKTGSEEAGEKYRLLLQERDDLKAQLVLSTGEEPMIQGVTLEFE
ncbi:hypothetical protein ACHAW6_009012 [Cyclotella cf. meneghiniana]